MKLQSPSTSVAERKKLRNVISAQTSRMRKKVEPMYLTGLITKKNKLLYQLKKSMKKHLKEDQLEVIQADIKKLENFDDEMDDGLQA